MQNNDGVSGDGSPSAAPAISSLGGVGESVIRTMTRLAIQYGAVNLSQGFPNEPPPLEVRVELARAVLSGLPQSNVTKPNDTTHALSAREELMALLESFDLSSSNQKNRRGCVATDELNQYSPPMGRPDLRHAIGKDYYERLYGYSILPSPEECVTVTLGATEAVASALRTLGRPGDKVVIFEPYHELYPSQCRIFYLDPVFVTLREEEEEASSCAKGWCFNEIELEHALSSARILILNTPHNPTGKVFSRDELKCIVNLCLKYKVFIVTDEIYEHMVYSSPRNQNKHILIPQEFPEVAHQTFVCNSMGKSASATGWRLGWCVHPLEFSHSYRGVHDQLVVMSPHPIQYAAMTYLRLPKDYFHSILPNLYVERLGLLSQTLRRVGFQIMSNVDGAYYLFAKYRTVPALTNKKPMEAAMYMIQTIGVACVPGDNFYGSATASAKEGQEYLRFAACRSLADIQEACQRIEIALLEK